MPTILSHPAILMALRPAFRLPWLVFAAGALCSVLPDFDVFGFQLGVHYGDVLGHRGLTHSIFFAVLISAAFTLILVKMRVGSMDMRFRIFSFLFACTMSHGILDAMTDGGLGVAFFSPFTNTRYFFPWRPLRVSPIGIVDFLSGPVLRVLESEVLYVWLPCAIILIAGKKSQRSEDAEIGTKVGG